MDNEELKLCPFCGSRATFSIRIKSGDSDKWSSVVRCKKCHAEVWGDEDKAIAKWNKRTNSEIPNNCEAPRKPTYADIERMVKPLEWKYISNLKAHYASTNKGMFFKIYKRNGDYVLSIDGNNPVAFSEKLSKTKQAAQDFLVDSVAVALGVKRSEE